jgi:hypothetical protein
MMQEITPAAYPQRSPRPSTARCVAPRQLARALGVLAYAELLCSGRHGVLLT